VEVYVQIIGGEVGVALLFAPKIYPLYLSLKKVGHVATLTLGSRPRQGLARVRVKKEAWESHFMLLGMQKSVSK
jgi:hypothetical protein